MIYYLDYGSNMDQNRMIERGVSFYNSESANLHNYVLKFNKYSKKQGAVANIVYSLGSIVEGILYEIDNLNLLDKYEGYPNHYNRMIVDINNKKAWVYFAQKEYIIEEIKPKKEYLEKLLAGKNYLSEDYYKMLEKLL